MYRDKIMEMLDIINNIILGKEDVIREITVALLANGHILLEDYPGVGKTTLAIAFARSMDIESKRVQFTPDVMPSDLTGFSVYRRDIEKFVYQEGAVFCNLLLADEINRTSPKTQSALLEVMEEGQVSVEGVTRLVPEPFWVIATQNPYGTGTQQLPITQMDRFIASMSLGYPDKRNEAEIAKNVTWDKKTDNLSAVINKEIIACIKKEIENIYIDESICEYIVDLVCATRSSKYLELGSSPRGTIALVKLCKSSAWLQGKEFVTPGEVEGQFVYAIKHRIVESNSARLEGISKEDILQDILDKTPRPLPGRK